MTQQNLVLSENAIKRHAKRLQKLMKEFNQDLSLGQAQNLFAKTLGFNNFHELKEILQQTKNSDPFQDMLDNFQTRGKEQYIVCYIRPVQSMNQAFQDKFKQYILEYLTQKHNIILSDILLNSEYILIYIDPHNEFCNTKNPYGTTVYGLLHALSYNLSKYMNAHGFHKYYNCDIAYKYDNKVEMQNMLNYENL